MKRFTRTTTGKVTLFILFDLLFLVLALCFGAVLTGFEEGLYEMTETQYLATFHHADSYTVSVVHCFYLFRAWLIPIGALAALGCLIVYITLICAAGKEPGTDALRAGHFAALPFDLLFVAAFLIGCLFFYIADECGWPGDLVAGIGGIVYAINAILGLSMGFAKRVKLKMLWRHTVLCKLFTLCARFYRFLRSIFRSLPMIWRTAVVYGGLSLLEILVIANSWDSGSIATFWFIERLILTPLILYAALCLRRLEKAGKALAEGDLAYRMETKGLFGALKGHADDLNSISDGMARSVEARLRSERMKTELITNVSHDIKTPLTSIINYTTLIAAEESPNENIREYSEVLLRQSEKLKRLVEDLVEASKASTGNLELAPEPCDAGMFLTQTAGEYAEKLDAASLALVTRLPEQETRIMADPRRMWRVFDNLMNNICKYSLPGTRVYLTLERGEGEAVISFKNTSREALDLSPEELTERFVRGDASRHSEGSGLGLSIARSFTELQGGKFELTVDGDLFKVTLRFPLLS